MATNLDAKVIDVILPIVEVEIKIDGLNIKRFLGTGFLIGGSSYLMTSAHVLSIDDIEYAFVCIIKDGYFEAVKLYDVQKHPLHDVAVCKVSIENHVASWLVPTSAPQHQSKDCQIWGYPSDVLFDSGQKNHLGRALYSPELIFTKAYIRRRISYAVPGFKGDKYYELNESAGAGCSGAPMIVDVDVNRWLVSGVYMGEVTTERTGQPMRSRGYAVRMEAVAEWLRSIDPTLVV